MYSIWSEHLYYIKRKNSLLSPEARTRTFAKLKSTFLDITSVNHAHMSGNIFHTFMICILLFSRRFSSSFRAITLAIRLSSSCMNFITNEELYSFSSTSLKSVITWPAYNNCFIAVLTYRYFSHVKLAQLLHVSQYRLLVCSVLCKWIPV